MIIVQRKQRTYNDQSFGGKHTRTHDTRNTHTHTHIAKVYIKMSQYPTPQPTIHYFKCDTSYCSLSLCVRYFKSIHGFDMIFSRKARVCIALTISTLCFVLYIFQLLICSNCEALTSVDLVYCIIIWLYF